MRDDHSDASWACSRDAAYNHDAYDDDTSVSRAQCVLRHQAAALLACADRLTSSPSRAGYAAALHILEDTVGPLDADDDNHSDYNYPFRPRGKIITTGVGKSAHIARKVTATLQSLATPAVFLHPTEAVHGDLGLLSGGDALLVFSHSGRTDELVHLLAIVRAQRRPCRVIAVCGDAHSPIARAADAWVDAAVGTESDRNLPAPTASTTLALALGDAIALGLAQARGVGAREFARHHPGGNLGRVLAKCTETRVREAVTVSERVGGVEMAYTEKMACSVVTTEAAAVHSARVEVSTSETVEVEIAYEHEATAHSETKRGADQRGARGIDSITPGTESALDEHVSHTAYDVGATQLDRGEGSHHVVRGHQTFPVPDRAAPVAVGSNPVPNRSTPAADLDALDTHTPSASGLSHAHIPPAPSRDDPPVPDRSTLPSHSTPADLKAPDSESLDTYTASSPLALSRPHTPSASTDPPVPDLSANLDADPDPLDTTSSSDSGSSRPRTPSAPSDSDSDRDVGRVRGRSVSPSRCTATTTNTAGSDFGLFDGVSVGCGRALFPRRSRYPGLPSTRAPVG